MKTWWRRVPIKDYAIMVHHMGVEVFDALIEYTNKWPSSLNEHSVGALE